MRGAAIVAITIVAIAGCGKHVASCDDELRGVWQRPSGERWFLLDNRTTLEAYPMFDDAVRPPGAGSDVVLAPRVIDLRRNGDALAGRVSRRFMRRADACEVRGDFAVGRCADDALEVTIGDPPIPASFAPCTLAPAAPPSTERWTRP